jgi:hypothetical protein
LVAGLLFGAFVVGFVVLHRQAATAAGAASPDPGLGASPAVVPTVDPGANAKPGASPSADPRPEPSVATPTTITAAPFVEGGLVGAASAAVLLAVVDAGAGRARPTAPRQMRPVTSYAPGNAPGNAPANAPASAPSAAPPAHREGDDGILGNRH